MCFARAYGFPKRRTMNIHTNSHKEYHSDASYHASNTLLTNHSAFDAGLPRRHDKFQLSPGTPSIQTTQFAWNRAGDAEGQRIIFQFVVKNNKLLELAEYVICNTFHEIESPVLTLFPNLPHVGPLLSGQTFGERMGHFWPVDTTCVEWLDEQPANSVVYVAFGSTMVLGRRHFEELAH